MAKSGSLKTLGDIDSIACTPGPPVEVTVVVDCNSALEEKVLSMSAVLTDVDGNEAVLNTFQEGPANTWKATSPGPLVPNSVDVRVKFEYVKEGSHSCP